MLLAVYIFKEIQADKFFINTYLLNVSYVLLCYSNNVNAESLSN